MKYIPLLLVLGFIFIAGFSGAFAQTEEDLNESSLDGTPPVYDIQVIEKGTSILGHVFEFNTTDSFGNIITCIVLEDKLSCYKNNVLPN